MTTLPNPGTFRVTFDTYAEAQGASILAPVSRIFVGDLCYVRDATGTALTTRGGAKWSPLGQATLAHWGVSGVPYLLNSAVTYTPPTVDETARVQQAVDWCLARGRDLIGDASRIIGITSTVYLGPRPGNSSPGTIKGGVRFADMNFAVIGGTWEMGDYSGTDQDLWTYGDAAIKIGGQSVNPHRYVVDRVYVDCRYTAATGIDIEGVTVARLSNLGVDRPARAGITVGEPNVINRSATDSILENIMVRGAPFGEPGYDDMSLRTSHGLVLRTSDFNVRGGIVSTCKINVVMGGGFNVQVSDLVSWTGKPVSGNEINMTIGKDAVGYRFVGCRFDDGQIRVRGFQGSFVGCYINQIDDAIRFIATEMNENANKFRFIANDVRGTGQVQLLTEGGGTWADFLGEWVGNTIMDGTSLTVQGKSLIQGYFTVYRDGRVRAVALTPTTSTPGMNAMWCVGADGTLYTYGGGNWYAHTGTLVTP